MRVARGAAVREPGLQRPPGLSRAVPWQSPGTLLLRRRSARACPTVLPPRSPPARRTRTVPRRWLPPLLRRILLVNALPLALLVVGAALPRPVPERPAGGRGHRAARAGAHLRRRAGRKRGARHRPGQSPAGAGHRPPAAAPPDRPHAERPGRALRRRRPRDRRQPGARGRGRRRHHRAAAAGRRARPRARHGGADLRPRADLLPHDRASPVADSAPTPPAPTGSPTCARSCGSAAVRQPRDCRPTSAAQRTTACWSPWPSRSSATATRWASSC